MANFFQTIIDKIKGENKSAENLDISKVASAAAIQADPRIEVAQREAAEAEAKKKAAQADQAAQKALIDEQMKKYYERVEAAAKAAQEVAAAAEQFEIIKEHTLTYDDTLSGLALHFYGHATPEYWGLIILANKSAIGDKVKDYTPGKVIKIPRLPESMKK